MTGTQKHKQYESEKIEKAVKELEEYRSKQRRLILLQEQQIRLQADYCGTRAMKYDNVKTKGGPIKNMLVETAVKWADLDMRIAHDKVEIEKYLYYIQGKMLALKYEEQTVLMLYFINGLSLEAIAMQMQIAFGTVKNLKKRALVHYSEV